MTESINESISNIGDCRTSTATPGLLNICIKLLEVTLSIVEQLTWFYSTLYQCKHTLHFR